MNTPDVGAEMSLVDQLLDDVGLGKALFEQVRANGSPERSFLEWGVPERRELLDEKLWERACYADATGSEELAPEQFMRGTDDVSDGGPLTRVEVWVVGRKEGERQMLGKLMESPPSGRW